MNRVSMKAAWKALQALLGYQVHQDEKVPQAMSSIPGLVLLAHLAAPGLWDGRDCLASLEALEFQVYQANLDNEAVKEN